MPIAADNASYLRRYFHFLGVDTDAEISLVDEQVNPDADADPDNWMSPEFRAELREVHAPDIARLEEMLDRDLSHWR